MNHKAHVAYIVSGLAEYYDKTLTAGQLAMYVEDLFELSPDELSYCIQEYKNRIDNDRFPLPSRLKSIARPQPSEEQNAIDAISRIIEAISKIGPYRTEEARNHIGELGWLVVQRDGGWAQVCQNLNEDNMGMTRAQWREMAKAFSARSRANQIDTPPALPKPSGGMVRFGDLISKALAYRKDSE